MRLKIFWWLLAFPAFATAQQQDYRGPVRLGVLQGDAEFSYTVKRTDTIFQGPFRLQGSEFAAPDKSPVSFFSVVGEFKDDLPIGNWQMRQGEFHSTGKGKIEDHHYQMKISGEEHFSTGMLEEGKPDQSWKVYSWRIEDSDIKDTLVSGTFSFDEGVPENDFHIRGDSLKITGSFDDGLPENNWEVVLPRNGERQEIWKFQNGVLQSIESYTSARTDTLRLPENSSDNLETLNLDARYFEIIRVLSTSAGFNLSDAAPNGFRDAIAHFYRADSVISMLSKNSFMPSFQARLYSFPISAAEEAVLDDISATVSESNQILDTLRSSAQLNLLKLSDTSIYFLIEAATTLEHEFILSLEKIMEYHEQEILRFLPRESVIPSIIPTKQTLRVNIPAKLAGDGADTKTYTLVDQNTPDTSGVFAARAVSQSVLASLKDITAQLEQAIKQQHREKKLVSLEKSLMAEYTRLQESIDSLQSNILETDGAVWSGLKSLADKELSRYSELKDRAAKTRKAGELTECFKNLDKLAGTVAEIPIQNKKIEDAFTQKVWNPYTYTYMTEKVKKRILSAYREDLIPYMMNEIENANECETAVKTQAQLERLSERMMELRMLDTGKLEKKLKKTQDPAVILRLFGLDENQQQGN